MTAAPADRVPAVHQHLRLDDRRQPRLLCERCVPGQCVGVGLDAGGCRPLVTDPDDGAPLGEPRAQCDVLLEVAPKPVEALGDHLVRESRERLGPRVDLDAGDQPGIGEDLGGPATVVRALSDRLVEEDHATDELRETLGREQHVAVGTAYGFGRVQADCRQPLGHRGRALVGCQDPLAGRDQRLRRVDHRVVRHHTASCVGSRRRRSHLPAPAASVRAAAPTRYGPTSSGIGPSVGTGAE